MTAPLLRRLRAGAGRLKRRLVPTGVMLMYHRVAQVAADPWDITVSPEAFEQQLQLLTRHRVRVLTAAEMAAALANKRLPKRSVAITFDDGYLDNLVCARPLLERYDMRATVFVCAGEVGQPDGFWWDRLGVMVNRAEHVPERVLIDGAEIDLSNVATGRREAAHLLWKSLAGQAQHVRDERLKSMARQLGSELNPIGARIMNEGELQQLADGGLIEVASHGWSHRLLGELSASEQRDEAERSRNRLEEILGRPVAGLSYPHGSRGPDTAGIVQAAGYAYACGSRAGLVRTGEDPFDLPRMEMRDGTPEQFERFLLDHVLS
jgi:peptidoglycan/xylan/chitin deacetylase (PgdA/CDA1 family)